MSYLCNRKLMQNCTISSDLSVEILFPILFNILKKRKNAFFQLCFQLGTKRLKILDAQLRFLPGKDEDEDSPPLKNFLVNLNYLGIRQTKGKFICARVKLSRS